jgi:hypothetical protein
MFSIKHVFRVVKLKRGGSCRAKLDFCVALGLAAAVFVLCNSMSARADIIVTVAATQDYADLENGTLAVPVMLAPGTTQIAFRATGGVSTFGSTLYSPDGLDSNGHPSGFRQTNLNAGGTYKGTPIGGTTGDDPALFGVFFSPTFNGTPANSVNYRSDSGITPDPRTLASYSPSLNQPFFIGDGYNLDNPYSSTTIIPAGTQQIFNVPAGATELLLGIGADNNLADNSNGSFTVDIASVPEPSCLVLLGTAGILALIVLRSRRRLIAS